MVRASAIGAIDFTACDDSALWWLGARMKLQAVEDDLYLRVMEAATHKALGVQGMPELGQNWDPAFRQQFAGDAVTRYQAEAMPWLGVAKVQNDTNTSLDDVAMWYAVFGKELGAFSG